MFITLLSKEIRDHILTFRFGAAIITTFALVVISVWILGNDFIDRRDSFNSLRDTYAEAAGNVFVPSMIEPYIGYAPSPLGIFAQGEERRFGNFVKVNRWEVPTGTDEGLSNNELLESLPCFDLLTVFTVIISLFAVLMSYDSISGERERGTLKMICTSQVRRGTIFSAKFSGLLVVIALPFVLSFVSALLILYFFNDVSFTANQWFAIGTMIITGLVYGSIFIAVGLISSALVRKSSTALVLALLFWAIGIFLIPLAGQPVAEALTPSPDATSIDDYAQAEMAGIDEEESRIEDEFSGINTTFVSWTGVGGSSYYTHDASPGAYRYWTEKVKRLEPMYLDRADRVYNFARQIEYQKNEQAALSAIVTFPSPASQLRTVFTALAGTGYATNDRFLQQARRFRSALVNNLRNGGYFGENAHLLFNRRSREDVFSEEKFQERMAESRRRRSDPDYVPQDRNDMAIWDVLGSIPEDLVPAFSYQGGQPDFATSLIPFTILVVMAVIAFLFGFLFFIRYDVR